MTPLRQRMIEDMQLRGFSARTQECYAAAVGQLAQHYHRSPDQLTEEDLRQYFLLPGAGCPNVFDYIDIAVAVGAHGRRFLPLMLAIV